MESRERVIFPMQPRVRRRVAEYRFERFLGAENVEIGEPLGYFEFPDVVGKARIVVTNSGGVQKEAYFMGKPCVTLREATEWIETVEDGWNTPAGANKEEDLGALNSFKPKGEPDLSIFGKVVLLKDRFHYREMACSRLYL
ncbi:MAG: UDP-N-acetylglucosamine 2-epimerase [Desulfurococcaceae archaeon]